MPKKNINDIRMPSYDDLFTNEEQRQEAKLEKIMELPISEIHEFKNHPFKVIKIPSIFKSGLRFLFTILIDFNKSAMPSTP